MMIILDVIVKLGSSKPSWTDQIQAWAAVIGVLGVVGTLWKLIKKDNSQDKKIDTLADMVKELKISNDFHERVAKASEEANQMNISKMELENLPRFVYHDYMKYPVKNLRYNHIQPGGAIKMVNEGKDATDVCLENLITLDKKLKGISPSKLIPKGKPILIQLEFLEHPGAKGKLNYDIEFDLVFKDGFGTKYKQVFNYEDSTNKFHLSEPEKIQ